MTLSNAEEFVKYWRSVRARTVRVFDCVPPGETEWTYAPGRFTFGDLMRHLANIERYMYAETVSGRPSSYSGHGRSFAEGHEAVRDYMARLHEESCAIFGALTEAQWSGRSTTPAGTAITTSKWLRAMIEHEAHHRGQIYLMLGLLGIKAPPIYGLTEEEVARLSSGKA